MLIAFLGRVVAPSRPLCQEVLHPHRIRIHIRALRRCRSPPFTSSGGFREEKSPRLRGSGCAEDRGWVQRGTGLSPAHFLASRLPRALRRAVPVGHEPDLWVLIGALSSSDGMAPILRPSIWGAASLWTTPRLLFFQPTLSQSLS